MQRRFYVHPARQDGYASFLYWSVLDKETKELVPALNRHMSKFQAWRVARTLNKLWRRHVI